MNEIRVRQKKTERKFLTRFIIYNFLLVAVTLFLAFFTSFFRREALRLLPPALFLLGIFLTKIPLFFTPKEFSGTIVHLKVTVEFRKRYASHQAGTKLTGNHVKLLELAVQNEKGKTKFFTLPYRKEYEALQAGDRVIVFRFVDRLLPLT